jgi:uncharacterized cupin superfamily protein
MKANLFEPEFDDESEREGFAYRDAWLGHQAGAERLGASLYEVGPGQATFPYHWHAGNEEMLIVLGGAVALRGPDGWRDLSEGEVVAFPRGEQGAHQVVNRSTEPARLLMLSEMRGPDICVYPDSGKVGPREMAPGSGKEGLRLNFLADTAVDYWEGEGPPVLE